MRAKRKLISFIGLGSGTAAPLLYSYVKAHSKLCFPCKETNFFSDTKVYAAGIDWYESLFKECNEGVVCGELAQDYLKSPQTVTLITRNYPSAKLFAVIENPLMSLRVAYVEALRRRTIPSDLPLAVFLKQNPEVLNSARYGKQLVNYFSFYSQNDLLVVLSDEVRENPLSIIAKVYEHIGVDKKFVPLALKHLVLEEEETGKKKPGLIKRTIKKVKKFFAKIYHGIFIKINPPKVPEETLAEAAHQINFTPELEIFLKDFYRSDVILLSNLLHRNLAVEWGFIEGE